ncbi:hypothetical protein LC612_30675 [Nostoc sp. CHAB 5834]|nr:hypothetical protein [Nostoc sp. CHAB 5834]
MHISKFSLYAVGLVFYLGTMSQIASQIGWFIFVGACMFCVSNVVRAVIKNAWKCEFADGEVFTTERFGDSLRESVATAVDLLVANWVASSCALAIVIATLLFTSIGGFASVGYGILSYLISGVVFPHFFSAEIIESVTDSNPEISQKTD